MSMRLWYPQLDAYDAVRRILALLGFWKPSPPSRERLCILDFYFANPPLLHLTHMPLGTRKVFSSLQIPRPEKAFLSYPSPPILFQKMEEVQRLAIQTVVGKGLVDMDTVERGELQLSREGRTLTEKQIIPLLGADERPLLDFLTTHFAAIGADDVGELRRGTGLRRLAQ